MNDTTPHLSGSDAEHSDLVGGSTARRRINCTASHGLEQLVPKDKGSIYALEGTALHEMMSIILTQAREPLDLLPFVYTEAEDRGGRTFEVSGDLWDEKGQPALDAFDALLDRLEEEYDAPCELLIEKQVEFPGIPGAFGTADVLGKCGPLRFAVDWKFGYKPVSSSYGGKVNEQLAFYLCGGVATHKAFFGTMNEEDPYLVSIIQPASGGGTTEPSVHRGEASELFDFIDALTDAVAKIERGEVTPRQGDWCTFASCQTVCPLKLNPMGHIAQQFAKLQDLRKEATEAISETVIDWSERYSDLLELADQVEPTIKKIREQAHEYAEAGGGIRGWVLTATRSPGRRWAKGEAELRKLMKNRKLALDDYMPRVFIPMPQAEKLFKKLGKVIPEDWVEMTPSSGTKLSREDGAKPVKTTPEKTAELAAKLATLTGGK